jgi:hypothetical protein
VDVANNINKAQVYYTLCQFVHYKSLKFNAESPRCILKTISMHTFNLWHKRVACFFLFLTVLHEHMTFSGWWVIKKFVIFHKSYKTYMLPLLPQRQWLKLADPNLLTDFSSTFGVIGLYFKTIMIVIDNCKWRHNLEHHLWLQLTTLAKAKIS